MIAVGGRQALRVVTWNLCSSTTRQTARLETAARQLSELRADVLCLQEAWDGAAVKLAGLLSMDVVAHSSVLRDHPSHVAILSRHAALDSGDSVLAVKGESGQASGYAYAVLDVGSRAPWAVHTAHLAWGAHSEVARARQAVEIEQRSAALQDLYPGLVQVLTGDFNALPESRTLRYLTGLEPVEGSSALWVDSWAKCGSGPGHTSDPSLSMAEETARTVGILDTNLLPQRRIDYVLVRGYAHGRAGCPLEVRLVDGEGASDHHGLVADLWLP